MVTVHIIDSVEFMPLVHRRLDSCM